jgi:PqqD family protein of HPr-rel-A system
MSGSAQPAWRIAPAGTLLTAEFDGQTVVYHTGVGHTHWISPVAAAVLHELASRPRDRNALRAALATWVGPEDLPLLDEALDETLDNLAKLGLIEPQADTP